MVVKYSRRSQGMKQQRSPIGGGETALPFFCKTLTKPQGKIPDVVFDTN
ncbi:MAG: hypothetical protein HC800_09865 [Phormidesmis sp. RL_2_1]|nr:hypothetical protein [Phormidesmis sp. RL_2_1]